MRWSFLIRTICVWKLNWILRKVIDFFISVLNVLVLTLIPFYFERFIERIKIFWTDSIFFNQGRIKRSKHFFLNKSKLVLRKRKKIKILNTSNNSFQIRKYVFGVEFFLGSYLLTKISFVKVSFYNWNSEKKLIQWS